MVKECNLYRRMSALCLLVVLIISGTGNVFGASDIAGHWAEPQIKAWLNAGIVTGYPDGSFKPQASVTRAEFMVMVNRAYELSGSSSKYYSDVSSGAWYAGAVSTASASGYITGYPNGTMRPDAPINRYETAVVIAKLNELASQPAAASGFSDASGMPAWAKGAVGAALQEKIMSGYPNGSFGGTGYITRAEAVVSLTRSLAAKLEKRVYDKPGVYGTGTVETVKGNVTVTSSDVTLRNMMIEGTLTLSKDIGSGSVVLENVTVKGSAVFEGGGPNSVRLEDSSLGTVTVSRPSGTLHLIAAGDTVVDRVIAKSDLKITESGLDDDGIISLTIEDDCEVSLIDTDLETLEMKAVGAELHLDRRSSVDKLTVSAKSAQIFMEEDGAISTLVANAGVAVTGFGTISRAEVNAAGVSFEARPQVVVVKSGIAAPAYLTPYIESFSPADGAVKVALNANIVLRFSETVRMTDGTALTNTNVDDLFSLRVGRASGDEFTFDATVAVSGGKTVVTVNPTADFLPEEDYFILLEEELEDSSNNPVTGMLRASFATVSEEVPRIESFTPENGAEDVAVDTDIVIIFSEDVRKTNNTELTSSNVDSQVVLKTGSSSGTSVAFNATVAVSGGRTVITVDPSNDLANSKTYYVAVSGLEDDDNQAVTGTLSATFTTVAPKEPPEIESFSPADGAEDVAVDANIVITFSEVVRMTANTTLSNTNVDALVVLKTPDSTGSEVLFDATVATVGGKTVITVNPTALLTNNTGYYAAVSGLEDAYNQAVTGTLHAEFTTVQLPADALDALEVALGADGSGGAVTLTPAFDGAVADYAATVSSGSEAVRVSPDAPNGNTAVVRLGSSIKADGVCPLAVGENVITVTVSKSNRADRVYTLTVTREP